MTEKDFKPVPKYILAKIKKMDKRLYPEQQGFTRFFAYLSIHRKELIKTTVAVRNYRKQWYYKQVAVHPLHSEKCYVKDMEYCYIGMGFRVGWYEEGIQRYPKWFERGWLTADINYYDPHGLIVNIEILDKLPEFKYSAYREYQGGNLLRYLRIYERFPQTEYLVKLGLHYLAERITVLRKIERDKSFRKWLVRNRAELKGCYAETVLTAYKSGKSITQTQKFLEHKKSFLRDSAYKPLKESFRGKLLERFFSYLEKQKIQSNVYLDYFKACRALSLDMSKEKNLFPHDFKRWHDIRIEEYATQKALKDQNERAELYKQFAAVSQKYLSLQHRFSSGLAVFIAKSPDELIREGELLNHCVGRMGYDRKMLREETLIFFLRKCSEPNTPFVTLEYSITKHKVLQCYAYGNVPPESSILEFVNNQWLPYANKQIKKIA